MKLLLIFPGLVALVLATSVGHGAGAGQAIEYRGTTSQGLEVALSVTPGRRSIRSMRFRVASRCRDGDPEVGAYELARIPVRASRFRSTQRLGSLGGSRSTVRIAGRFLTDGRVGGNLRVKVRRAEQGDRGPTTCRGAVTFDAEIPAVAKTRFGALHPLRGRAGCLTGLRARGCAFAPGLRRPQDLVLAPGARHMYVAADFGKRRGDPEFDGRWGGVVGLRVGTAGGPRPLAGPAGCARADGGGGCSKGRGLYTVRELALSSDGRHVYAVSSRAIAIFSRDPATGGLTQAPGPSGCIAADGVDGCATARSFGKTGLADQQRFALSRDGRHAYLFTKTGEEQVDENSNYSAVLAFMRDPATGSLTQLPGAAGCVTAEVREGCGHARLADVGSLMVTPDGRHLYATSPLDEPALTAFTRDSRTGALAAVPGRAGCLASQPRRDCVLLRGVASVHQKSLITRNGRHVYAAGFERAIAAFTRDARTGQLKQLHGRAGCLSSGDGGGPCSKVRGLSPTGAFALSPDERSLYVGGTSLTSALVALARDRGSGRLLQLPGRAGCLTSGDRLFRKSGGTLSCAQARFVGSVSGIAVAPNGKRVYTSDGSWSVATFARHRGVR